jgi:hypothetical protein
MAMRKIPPAAIAAIAVLGLVLTVTTAGLLSINQTVPSAGTITVQTTPSPSPSPSPSSSPSPSPSPSPPPTLSLGVYSDSPCTQPLMSIDWGTISPGGSVVRTMYVKNTGGAQLTLSMATNGWSPAGAGSSMSLSWDRESTVLGVGQSTAATLTLSVSSSISGITSFSVNIVITGTG